MEIVNARIAKLFEESSLTVRDLAELAGCSKSALQRYIAGDRSVPTSVVEGLAKAFKVHPAYIFGWVDDRYYKMSGEELADSSKLTPEKAELIKRIEQMSEKNLERLNQILDLVERKA